MLRFISMRLILVLLLLVGSSPVFAVEDECVILLHGLGRTASSMLRIELELEDEGYIVWNRSYPSRQKTIEELTVTVGNAIEYCRAHKVNTIHFVTHSMGGILVRHYFQTHDVKEAQRVVMLAPPNKGSEVADQYRDESWYQFATGPAGQQLGTNEDSVPNKLKVIPLEVGIIAGARSSDPWFSEIFNGDNDGKVSVASTRLPEMNDFLVVESGHTFIMNDGEVIRQIKSFLKDGRFLEELE
jgi:pimeloyl-ACP methyl ester carboxylesterase